MSAQGQKSPNPITLLVLFAVQRQTMTGLATPIPRLTAAMLMQLREEISQACAVLVRWIVVSGASNMLPNNQLLSATRKKNPPSH